MHLEIDLSQAEVEQAIRDLVCQKITVFGYSPGEIVFKFEAPLSAELAGAIVLLEPNKEVPGESS